MTLSKNTELSTHANNLQRAFVVCVRETKYDNSKEKLLTKYEKINVFVGAQADIDVVKKEVEEFFTSFKGTFKSDYRIRAIWLVKIW